MPRAHIDLSWLLGLMTDSPTAGDPSNPAYNAAVEDPYTDPLTGNTAVAHGYTLPDGTPVDASAVDKFGTTNQFKAPTVFQRAFYPQQSSEIDKLNLAPTVAGQENAIRTSIYAKNAAKLRDTLPEDMKGLSDEQIGLMFKDNLNPSYVGQEDTSLLNNRGGMPATTSAIQLSNARHTLAQLPQTQHLEDTKLTNDLYAEEQNRTNQLKNENVDITHLTPKKQSIEAATLEGGEDRAKMANAITREQQMNEYAKATGVDRKQLELAGKELDAQLGRSSTMKELGDYIAANNLAQAKATSEAQPYLSNALKNNAIRDSYLSNQFPVGAPIVNRIDSTTGNINPLEKNPTGMSEIAQTMAGLDDLKSMTGGGVQKITLPSGQTIGVKSKPAVTGPIDAMTGKPIQNVGTRATIATAASPNTTNSIPNTSNPFANAKTNSPAAIVSRVSSIDKQLNDPDFMDRVNMYPQKFKAQYDALVSEKEDLQNQLKELMGSQMTRKPIGSVISFPQ